MPFCGNVFESSGVDMRSSQKILRPSYISLLPVRAKHWSEFLEKCGEEEANSEQDKKVEALKIGDEFGKYNGGAKPLRNKHSLRFFNCKEP